METYRKVVFSKPWTVEIQEDRISLDAIPAGQVIVKTHYTLISAGTELACLSGGEAWFPLPGVMGYANVGEVVAAGKGADKVKVGDVIFTHAGHAGYCAAQLGEPFSFFSPVPKDVVEKEAPFARMAGVAITSLRVSAIELGDWVAVTGMGLVGNMAAQLAGLQGARVIAIDLNDKRLALAEKCGVEHIVNPGRTPVKDRVAELTGGKGVTTLIEATGAPRAVLENLPLMAKGGELILLGSPRGEYNADLTKLLDYCHLYGYGCITFKGAHEWRYPVQEDNYVKHSFVRNTEIIFRLMAQGRLAVKPLISHVIKPEETPAAYDGLRRKPEEYQGVIIDWT